MKYSYKHWRYTHRKIAKSRRKVKIKKKTHKKYLVRIVHKRR